MLTVLEKIGVVFLAYYAFKLSRSVFRTVYVTVVAPSLNLQVDLKKQGRWAVITGCTDGIGKSFSEELAKLGMDIVLISRTKSKLDDLAAEIEEKYKVNAKTIEADFAKGENEGSEAIYSTIEKQLYGLDIGVLINNVGLSYPYPEQFLNVPNHETVFRDMVRVNITAMLNMCQIVMPAMVENKRGVVINVSSTSAHIPSPYLTVYGATKMFVSKFSEDLGTEYKKQNIIVQCLTPGYVATKMSKIRKASWMAPTPTTYVRKALKTVGIEKHTTGYYPHRLLGSAIGCLQSISPSFAEWIVVRTLMSIRARALSKKSADR